MKKNVRVKVIVTLYNSKEVLLCKGIDPNGNREFYIPLGGGLEFGESLSDCAMREVKEESGIQINKVKLLDHIENHFYYNGIQGHEIIFHFASHISDELKEKIPSICQESNGEPFEVKWYNRAKFLKISENVVPESIVFHILQKI